VTIGFRRNLPFDMAASVEQFVKVYGILPDKVALKLFPATFIPDPDEVADEMEEAKGIPSMDSPDDSTDSGMEASLDDTLGSGLVPGADVQAQALNGAQVASLVTVAQAVADKMLPLATAVEIVLVSMPSLTRDDAMRMLGPASAFTPDKPDPAPAFGGAQAQV
jgi:hypothetical protein